MSTRDDVVADLVRILTEMAMKLTRKEVAEVNTLSAEIIGIIRAKSPTNLAGVLALGIALKSGGASLCSKMPDTTIEEASAAVFRFAEHMAKSSVRLERN